MRSLFYQLTVMTQEYPTPQAFKLSVSFLACLKCSACLHKGVHQQIFMTNFDGLLWWTLLGTLPAEGGTSATWLWTISDRARPVLQG